MIKSVDETHYGFHFTHAVLLPESEDERETWDRSDAAWTWIVENTPGASNDHDVYPFGARTAYPIVINLADDGPDGWDNLGTQEYWIAFTCYEDAFAFLMRFG